MHERFQLRIALNILWRCKILRAAVEAFISVFQHGRVAHHVGTFLTYSG